MSRVSSILTTLPLLALSACMVGPDYQKSSFDAPKTWVASDISSLAVDSKHAPEELSSWWKVFGDDVLCEVVRRAIENNFDLQTARSRIEQAAATLGMRKSGLWPTLDADASFREGASPLNASARQSYGWGATAGWEIDIFGGVRRGIEISEQDYRASLADAVATRVKITADVARAYFTYRAYQAQLQITKENLQAQMKTYEITARRKANGLVSQLDVVQAAAEVSSTNAQLPKIEENKELALRALELLVGVRSGELSGLLSEDKPLPHLENFIPVGVPAQLVQRRPDIIAAEHRIHAAVAAIGEAEADFYPRFSITGTISYDTPKIGGIVSNPYGSWSVGPTATWNIFQAGKTVNNVKLQEAVLKEVKISWQLTVYTAIKEVEDALVSTVKERERIMLLNTLVSDNKKAYELSKTLYSAGEIEFLDLLVTQRQLLSSQQNQISSRMDFVNNVVSLYKALGGGWNGFSSDEKTNGQTTLPDDGEGVGEISDRG